MKNELFRALALFLAAQPVLWMSDVALAQSLVPEPLDPTAGQGQGPGQGLGSIQGQAQSQGLGSLRGAAGPGGSLTSGALLDPGAQTGAGGPWSAAPSGGQGTPGAGAGLAADQDPARAAFLAPARTGGLPPIDEPLDPDQYVMGPGDVLELNFWGLQNYKVRATVDLEGRAFVPRVGYFSLRGKTLSEARNTLREAVARLLPGLGFGASLAEPRTFIVQVVDDVVRPGSYQAMAVERVAALILRAGGFGPRASRRRIEIRRRSGEVVPVDLLLYALTGDLKHNPHLLDGDVVRVRYEEVTAAITGAVNRPGRYELVGSRDLAELVGLAGGLAPTATELLPVTVVRRGEGDREDLLTFRLEGGKLPAVPLRPEDGVRIPSAAELQQSIFVVGAIAGASALAASGPVSGASGASGALAAAPDEATATRRLPFVKGDTVRTLLERVGGVGPLADLTGAYILRNGTSVPVDLDALVMLRDLRADRPVEIGDTLVIPFKRRNVLVEGAVFAPGSYPYNPAFGIDEYVSIAGGRSRNALGMSDIKLVLPNGETREYRKDLKIEPGSSLVVPERTFSRPEIVQIVLGTAGILVSAVAVVLAARR